MKTGKPFPEACLQCGVVEKFAEGKDIVGDRAISGFYKRGGDKAWEGNFVSSSVGREHFFFFNKVRCCDFLGKKWRRRCGGLLGSWRLRSPRAEHRFTSWLRSGAECISMTVGHAVTLSHFGLEI